VELIAAIFMLGAGGALAVFVLAAMKLDRAERGTDDHRPPQRDSVAASLLFHVVSAGGGSRDEAMRQVRRGSGIAAPVIQGIDVGNWAESYARHSSHEQRSALLEMAVQLVAQREGPVPLRQYAALLDLSFGLGFHIDALARLRESYGFEYVDHAKDARVAAKKGSRPPDELLATLGITGTPTRQELSAAYRKLVTQHHPDRFHGAPAEAQNSAAARFIEITRAYEELLLICRD
jgi:DnaJ-domain-containing protein 1